MRSPIVSEMNFIKEDEFDPEQIDEDDLEDAVSELGLD